MLHDITTFAAPNCSQSIIIRAQGEAKSAELVGESLKKNKGFLELRKLEAAREIATTLADSRNKVMLDSDTLLLNGRQSQLRTIHPTKFYFSCWKCRRWEKIQQIVYYDNDIVDFEHVFERAATRGNEEFHYGNVEVGACQRDKNRIPKLVYDSESSCIALGVVQRGPKVQRLTITSP